MPSDELSVPMTEGRFRERRAYLSPEAFADPGDGITFPTDLIDRNVWMHLMDLPTDVALQTTDHFGQTFRAMGSVSAMWISAITPGRSDLPLVFDAYLERSTLRSPWRRGWVCGVERRHRRPAEIRELGGPHRWSALCRRRRDHTPSGRPIRPEPGRCPTGPLQRALPIRAWSSRQHQRRHLGEQRPRLRPGGLHPVLA